MEIIERRKVGMSGKGQLYIYLPHIKNLNKGDFVELKQITEGLLLTKARKR